MIKLTLTTLLFLIVSCASRKTQPEASSKFLFQSSTWINLHHFLYHEAGRPPSESKLPARMQPMDKKTSEDAINFYRTTYGKRDLLFDKELPA